MNITMPFNFDQWIKDNKDKLKPPVSNKNMYPLSDDYIVMVVAGRLLSRELLTFTTAVDTVRRCYWWDSWLLSLSCGNLCASLHPAVLMYLREKLARITCSLTTLAPISTRTPKCFSRRQMRSKMELNFTNNHKKC